MRDLTKKQKVLLDRWFAKHSDTVGFFWKVDLADNFSSELYHKIDDLNPCEIINQNINNYIGEKARKLVYGS